ncbi:hypothetical protein ACFSKU_11725 [Pontibacter silvestris]|uniref:DUF748 domain-containing protein n=1 Tax=Pontibacter silvestris TaxID=2305183 RepID=A0ABW4WXV0_9BACT|nr:hypothetical protein [Pontibacter silvestris]MCC9135313.1 hypothetical protein [Pontibacter silvestris]
MIRNNAKAKAWLKAVCWTVGIALLLFTGLFFFTNWLENKIETMVYQESDGVNKLQLYGLHVSPFLGSVSVDSLSLTPDYERWQQLQNTDTKTSRMLIDIHTKKTKLRGLNTIGLVMGKSVKLDKLVLQQPEILFTVMRQDITEQHKPLHETVKGVVEGVQINEIDIDNATLRFRNKADAAESTFAIKQFNLTVDDFKLDKRSFRAKDRAYYANNIQMEAAQVSYLLPSGGYRITTDSIKLNTSKRTLLANNLKLVPQGAPNELAREKGKSITYNKAQIQRVAFTDLDYPAHSRNNNFIAKHLLIVNPNLSAFKDKKNFPDENEQKPLPHEMVQSVSTKFLIDTIDVKGGFIRYAELVPKAEKPGYITFQELNVTITNLSNIPAQISLEHPAVIQANTMVMGKSSLQIEVRLPLLNKNYYHTLSGRLGETNPEILNKILEPTSFISIKSGHISEATFEAELTKQHARGSMKVIYSNFKIDLLSKEGDTEQSLGKEILSKVANLVAIKSSNPDDKGEAPRTGEITVDRNSTKSVFNYWKDCLASGFLSSAGLDNKAEK